MEQWLVNNPATTEYHFPGQNFTGPGTNLVRRIYNGDLPVNYTDAVTLLHDLHYMSYKDINQADDQAIALADYSLVGLATKLGLSVRKLLNLKLNTPNYELSQVLKSYLLSHPKYKSMLKLYKLYDVLLFDSF